MKTSEETVDFEKEFRPDDAGEENHSEFRKYQKKSVKNFHTLYASTRHLVNFTEIDIVHF